MALLIVDALAEAAMASPGNRLANSIFVSVTDSAGIALMGLTRGDFMVDVLNMDAGGVLVTIESVSMVRLPGTYIVKVVPMRTETWKAGVYIFVVVVRPGHDRGQSLCTVLMD